MTTTNQSILQDLKRGKDVSLQLQSVFNVSTAKTRADSLDLCKKVLNYVTSTISEHGYQSFHIAIQQLRQLIPYLKKSTTSNINIISMIEKHSVNYALLLITNKKTLQLDVTPFLETTIKHLFDGRIESKSTKKSQKSVLKPTNLTSNCSNQQSFSKNQIHLQLDHDALDTLLFPGAQQYAYESLLPRDDTVQTALVITGALTLKLYSGELSLSLSQLEFCVKHIILPWTNYVKSLQTTEQQHLKVYLDNIHAFLLEQCYASRQMEPFLVLRVRSLALRLGSLDLHSFAKSSVRCCNAFLKQAEKDSMSIKSINRVAMIHEELTEHLLSFSEDDPDWSSEYVSALLDDVAIYYSRQNHKQQFPTILKKRIAILSNQENLKGLVNCCQLQIELLDAGGYNPDVMTRKNSNGTRVLREPEWERLSHLVRNFSERYVDNSFFHSVDEAESRAWISLRVLRIIEPIRKLIFFADRGAIISRGTEIFLREYCRILILSLRLLQSFEPELLEENESTKLEIHKKLQDMSSGALQAILEFLKHNISAVDADAYAETISSAAEFVEVYRPIDPKERSFVTSSLIKVILQQFSKKLKSCYAEEQVDTLELSNVTGMIERTLTFLSEHFESFFLQSQKVSFFQLLREFFVFGKLADCTLITSAKLLQYVFEGVQNGLFEHELLQEIAKTFLSDIRSNTKSRIWDTLFTETSIQPEIVLALLLEYERAPPMNLESNKQRKFRKRSHHDFSASKYQVIQLLNHENCLLLSLHALWIKFRVSETFSDTETGISDILSSSRNCESICGNHTPIGFFGEKPSKFRTKKDHSTMVVQLAEVWQLTASEKFVRVKSTLEKICRLLTKAKDQWFYPELLQLASEILSWTALVFIQNDYMQEAVMADALVHKCKALLCVPKDDIFWNYLCMRLGDSVYKMGSHEIQKMRTMSLENVSLSYSSIGKHNEALDLLGSQKDAITCYAKSHILNYGKGEVVEATVQATNSLKFYLRDLRHDTLTPSTDENDDVLHIAGSPISIRICLKEHKGQQHFISLLSLTECLILLGNLHFVSENLDEACYFYKQGSALASKCFSENNRRIKCVRLDLLLSEGLNNGIDGSLTSQLIDLTPPVNSFMNSKYESLSEFKYFMVFYKVLFSLALASGNDFSYLFDAETFNALFERSQELLGDIQKAHDSQRQIQQRVAEHGLRRGMMMILRGEFSNAAEELSLLIEKEPVNGIDLQAEVNYLAGYCLLASVQQHNFGSQAISTESQTTLKSRVSTRSRTRASSKTSETSTTTALAGSMIIERAKEHLIKGCELATESENPRLSRNTFRNFAMARKMHPDILFHLAQSIGQSFNLRQRYVDYSIAIKRGISFSSPASDSEEELAGAFRSLSTNPENFYQFPKETEDSLRRLIQSQCVLVGLNIDEGKENLALWRICSLGKCVQSIALPKETHLSYDGIVQRIKNVLEAAKSKAVKTGQTTTEQEKLEWWEHRYELDQTMYQILADIEESWFGKLVSFLLPAIREDNYLDCERPNWNNIDAESISQLAEAISEGKQKQPVRRRKNGASSKKKSVVTLGQLVLITDTILERIPWESLPSLRKLSVSVTRAPSLKFLNKISEGMSTTLEEENVFYVVNPGGDLYKTEERFQGLIEYREEWSGLSGRATSEDIVQHYSGEHILLFCGHGAGDAYFNPRRVCKYTQAPVALLMGCSSVKPKNVGIGDCESNGTAIDYLIRGSRAVVGCLWDVSDGDLDRLTLSMLSHWFGEDLEGNQADKYNLAESVAQARNVCRFPSLVGASCIVMGTPNVKIL